MIGKIKRMMGQGTVVNEVKETKPRQTTIAAEKLERFLGEEEARVQVLKGVDIHVYPGKAYAIMGPSGCGKSTLLYLLGLLDKPNGGDIYIGDLNVTNISDHEATQLRNRYLGFVFQFHFLIKEFTALENVLFPMQRYGILEPAAMVDRAQDLLSLVGLGMKSHRRTNHLSGGEQQRVAIARALANAPQVILADEPTGNLDSRNSAKVYEVMTNIVRTQNLSLVTVTHNPDISEVSDVALRMEDGHFISKSH